MHHISIDFLLIVLFLSDFLDLRRSVFRANGDTSCCKARPSDDFWESAEDQSSRCGYFVKIFEELDLILLLVEDVGFPDIAEPGRNDRGIRIRSLVTHCRDMALLDDVFNRFEAPSRVVLVPRFVTVVEVAPLGPVRPQCDKRILRNGAVFAFPVFDILHRCRAFPHGSVSCWDASPSGPLPCR